MSDHSPILARCITPILLLATAAQAQPVFGPPSIRTLGVTEPVDSFVADFDNNGHLDIAVSGSGGSNNSGEMIILLSDGSGTFPDEETVNGPVYGFGVGDLNNDGILDIVTTSHNNFNPPYFVRVFFGNGNGGMTPAGTYITNSAPYDAAVGDFNNDGWADIVAGGERFDAELLLNNGDGTFGPATLLGSQHNVRPTKMYAADLDHDGIMDFYEVGTGAREYLSNGDGTFTIPTAGAPAGQVLHDMNHDGVADSVVAFHPHDNSGIGRVLISLGNLDGSFNFAMSSQNINVFPNRPVDLSVADFDNDGNPDVVGLANTGGTSGPAIYLGNGDGTLQPASTAINVGGDGARLVVAGDFNEDGWADIFVPDRGFGDEAFAYIYLQSPPAVDCIADLTGDGVLDFLDISAFLNDFASMTPPADLNSDGSWDFLDISIFLTEFMAGCP